MNKRSIKFLSILLVLIFAISVFTACGKTDDTSKTPDGDGEQVDQGDQPNDDEEEEVRDFGGRTIKLAAWWDLEPQEGRSDNEDLMVQRFIDLQAKYNMKLEYVNVGWGEYREMYQSSVLAGAPFADLAFTDGQWYYPSMVVSGMVTRVDDLGVFDFSEPKWNATALEYGQFDGKQYGFDTGRAPVGSGIFWNKTMFERDGQPNLYDLVDSKEWTWEKMREIAIALTKDLDGDGAIDQWGLGDMQLMWSLLAANGARSVIVDGDKAVFGLGTPEALEALQFYQDLFTVHKVVAITPEGGSWDYHLQAFCDGKIGMLSYPLWWAETPNENMEDDYGFVPDPLGPKSEEYSSSAWAMSIWTIPGTIEKPDEVAIFYDEWTEPFPGVDPNEGAYEDILKDRKSIEYGNMISDKALTIIEKWNSFTELQEMGWSMFWEIYSGNKTPHVAIAEYAERGQAILDDAFAK